MPNSAIFKTFFYCGTGRSEAVRSVMAENQLSEVLMERDQDLIPFHCGLYNASNRRKLSAISATNAVFFCLKRFKLTPKPPFNSIMAIMIYIMMDIPLTIFYMQMKKIEDSQSKCNIHLRGVS